MCQPGAPRVSFKKRRPGARPLKCTKCSTSQNQNKCGIRILVAPKMTCLQWWRNRKGAPRSDKALRVWEKKNLSVPCISALGGKLFKSMAVPHVRVCVCLADEREGRAAAPRPRRATGPVHERVGRARKVVVHHRRHLAAT